MNVIMGGEAIFRDMLISEKLLDQYVLAPFLKTHKNLNLKKKKSEEKNQATNKKDCRPSRCRLSPTHLGPQQSAPQRMTRAQAASTPTCDRCSVNDLTQATKVLEDKFLCERP